MGKRINGTDTMHWEIYAHAIEDVIDQKSAAAKESCRSLRI